MLPVGTAEVPEACPRPLVTRHPPLTLASLTPGTDVSVGAHGARSLRPLLLIRRGALTWQTLHCLSSWTAQARSGPARRFLSRSVSLAITSNWKVKPTRL